MENSNKIGFLFDLDGVIIDSESEYTRIWSEINDVIPTGVKNFALVIKGQTLPEILNTYFETSRHQEVIDMLNKKEQKMIYKYLPGARELLNRLRSESFESILVTSSNELKMQHLREERPELESYFKDIITADKITRSKPDPEGYLLGALMLGVKPERCAVFEDSKQGVIAGHSAGAYVVGLLTTLPKEELEPYCNILVKDLTEINIDKLINILKDE